MDELAIPEFLRMTDEERARAWDGRKIKKMTRTPFKFTRNEDAQTKAFRKELEKKAEAKKRERFAMLRARAAEQKKAAAR